MDKVKIAHSLFKEGFNCSQALLATYGTDLGLVREKALKVASAFGGGMGRMGETCGAVTGAFMVIGLKYGATSAKDKISKAKTYELAREFVKRFKSRNNTIVCKELIGFDMASTQDISPHLNRIVMEQCPKYIKDAAEIIEEIL